MPTGQWWLLLQGVLIVVALDAAVRWARRTWKDGAA